jgi:hypothetical protein
MIGFLFVNEFSLENYFQIYRSERYTATPFNVMGRWRTLRNHNLNEYRSRKTEGSWMKIYEQRLSLRNRAKKGGGITYVIHCRLTYLSVTAERFPVWGQSSNIAWNLSFLSVHIEVNSDNKLKRHLNISYCVGVYDHRFNRKRFVFYFVSVIIKNICSKLH